MSRLTDLITATDPAVRNRPLDEACAPLSLSALIEECAGLEAFRRRSDNLYERVRALFFLYAIHRFHVPARLTAAGGRGEASVVPPAGGGLIPFPGFTHLLNRRFEEAITSFLAIQTAHGPSDGISSALAAAYHRLAFQTLADQVRRSVRTVRGNQWMFRMGHPLDQPLRLRPELTRLGPDGTYPILRESTPVRMDLTHCGWSDIFFLGMDYPEGAKVLNVSIDLGVHGRDTAPRPPVEAYFRLIAEPVLRLTSVDLGCTADIASLGEVFDFAKDYLGLLKAAVIASGLVPPGIEGSGQSLAELLAQMCGPGRGIEIVSRVNDIPKGSRLAVSTNLLAALVAVCMRATGQAASLTGALEEPERRLVLARALLGEWLGGSGGGWQDSGGVWPGMKLIEGALAVDGDPEFGVSRGRLMPTHRILTTEEVGPETRRRLQESLVLVHGGMAQNVGPILEMVTEKYLLRSGAEWRARLSMLGILDEILDALRRGDVRAVGMATTRNFREPIQAIIPWASNHFTETLIGRVRSQFGGDFWGFWMLGGMSGGGMGFIFAPARRAEAQEAMRDLMSVAKRELEHALPFAMEPVVYDFAINERGTWADWLSGERALMPVPYYTLTVPALLRQDRHALPAPRRAELDKLGAAARTREELRGIVQTLFEVMLPRRATDGADGRSLPELLDALGFDRTQHEQIRHDVKEGRIGLAQNRLRPDAVIEDVRASDVVVCPGGDAGTSHEPAGPGGARLLPSHPVSDPDPARQQPRSTRFMAGEQVRKEQGTLHEPPQERGLQSAGTPVGPGTSLRAEARAPHRFMATQQVKQEPAATHEPLTGRAGCPERATPGAPGTARATQCWREAGLAALRRGEVAVFTLAAGAGSRWTQGAGVVKALHPFCRLAGKHRTFIEAHLAKSRRVSREAGCWVPHLISTSYLTHEPIATWLERHANYGYEGPVRLSPGRSIGLRLVPTVRDLRFMWEEMPQQVLDEQQQKVRDSLRHALMGWAQSVGEATDYTDNVPLQCLHPVGHWYEVPNLLRNGVLAELLEERPHLQHLMLHNIDTLGADADPALLGLHLEQGAGLTFEVIGRRLEDRGGGLARVNGRVRLVEGLAMPREEDEFRLTYYNSNTCWIHLDKLLAAFGLTRAELRNPDKVTEGIRTLAAKMPTYVTLKEVKKRWGHGQEDVFPVTQFEKLWVDMSTLPEVETRFVVVPRLRGQQLKDQAQLDGWLRDGSAAYLEGLGEWG